MKVPDPASAAQIAASDPLANVWLVANAGSGKTKVLTDRVARLLLQGVDPQNILCLTYTKAAAAEMQNRLFRRLGEWAMAAEDRLRADLARLGQGGELTGPALAQARRLFARAIETPGGIRIQTIHSFCAGLLRRFPLEAGVSPSFTELDDRSAALLRAEILEEMAEGPEAALFEAILPEAGEQIDNLLRQIVGQRADLIGGADPAALRTAFELDPQEDEAALLGRCFAPGDGPALAALVPALLASGKSTDNRAGALLATLSPPFGLDDLAVMEGVFLTGASAKAPFSAKIGSFPTKETRAGLGDVMDQVEGLMARVEAARPVRLALVALRKALALHDFAQAFLRRYEAAKARRGWLDFDDFITRATRLLTDPAIAPWVLFRLDGAIDHVLVDEAQDTSPAQWRIIAALTEEFTAGRGARDIARSLFVVGDKKQSIYSFQGADVVAFDGWKSRFSDAFRAAGAPVLELPLVHSFRSSRAVLDLVDACFRGDLEPALGGAFEHRPFHQALPGRVEIWPPVPAPEKPEPKEWYDPVDLVGQTDAAVVLAERIAGRIAEMIHAGVQIPDHLAPGGARPVRAGDFLILVQRRGEIFESVIRACKSAGLAIAGPDRLTLSEELAVRDILAALAFLVTPEDDLSLATALRSPLFGWSEAQLYRLAHGRKGYLWEALRQSDRAEEAEALAILRDLRDSAEFLRPYDLIDRLLNRHRGRSRLLARLGEEAADAIDELSQQALAYERAEVPSLTGFLVWMAAGEIEVKRQPEGEGSQIRVMTVHGSKGLEAPVVILPDTADRQLRDRDMILPLAESVVTWAGRKAEDAGAVAARKAARAAAREAENLRLLYVAMTRAKHWLIVAGAGECGETSWHGIIRRGALRLGAEADPAGALHLGFGDWPPEAPAPAGTQSRVLAPDFALRPASAPPEPLRIWSPSGLGGEKVVLDPGAPFDPTEPSGDGDPLERGTALHLALQHLGDLDPSAREEALSALGLDENLAQEARAILTAPELAWLFAPGSLAEVEVAVPWNGGWLAGAIDRLVIAPDRITIVDFKSNRAVPLDPGEVPEAYLRQLGAYALAMAALYPGRRIETAILWTRLPHLMRLETEAVRAALARAEGA
ncbi:double-strand break repair helicase AddA [Pseudogemmobacter sonorensis]|uniref:double-strand break repair helicase AddA n=1 Tax=Pseudogemmobacter sonorensis TaxID=2989681 RepID=UPI00368399EB